MADSEKTSRVNHPFVLGVLVGLLLGTILAVAVALYVNRMATPFIERQRTPDIVRPTGVAPKPDVKKADASGTSANKVAQSGDSKYEFYQVTPGDRTKSDKDGKDAGKEKPADKNVDKAGDKGADKAKAEAKPESKADAKQDVGGERSFVQAGSFPNESDADNLKGKIAFMGLEATVVPVDLAERGTWYRVRLGPYKSADEANRIKTQLSQQGVSATIVK
jgi:cell division protein FtsN